MNTIVLQLLPQELEKLIRAYQGYQAPNKDKNKTHFFKVEGTAISLYSSGKVMFQGNQAQTLAAQWGQIPKERETDSPVDNHLSTIGSDEVGNGSYFGGLAVVASLVTPDQHGWLRELGVGDSKTLTDSKIKQLAPLLEAEIPHQSLLLSPQKYNEIIPGAYNATSVKVALHNQAIYLLLQKVPAPEQIIIDAFTSPSNYQKYLKAETNRFDNPIRLVEKAEGQYLAVAVSSIIARSMFLRQLDHLGQTVGCKLPSGAGANSDKVAAHLLKTKGKASLTQTAKLHFKNTEKAEKLTRKF